MNPYAEGAESERGPFVSTLSESLRDDLLLFTLLGVLGVAASYLSVNIPHTEVHIEGRWAFGFMGFALLRRFWLSLLLAALLSASGPHQVPMSLVLPGNMLYAVPALATIRAVHRHILSRFRSLWLYGAGWFALVVMGYQLFNTPITWALMGLLQDRPVWSAVLTGWRIQPYFVELLLVGVVSAAAMVALRCYENQRQSQHELAITLDSIGDGVIAADVHGRVTRMNPVAQSLTGWSLEAARGKPLEEVFCILNGQTRKPVENPVKRVLREGRIVGLANHACLIARDGTEYQIADSASPLKETDGRMIGAVMVFRDVTQEYSANTALARSAAMLARTEHIAGVGSWEWDVAADATTWSEGLFRLFRLDPSEGAPSFAEHPRLYLPEDMAALSAAVEAAVAGGTPYELRLRAIRSDGDIRHCLARGYAEMGRHGKATRLYGFLRDITDHHRAETALRENEEKYRMLVELSPDLIAVHQDGRFLFINEGGCKLLGVSRPEAVIGQSVREFIPADQREGAWQRVEQVLGSGRRSPVYEQTIVRADGEERHVEAMGIPIDYNGGKALQIIARDVTEKIRLNEEKAKLEVQFHQSQKLESVGRLAGGVAHDLNNLLAPIMGYAEMLLEDFGEDDPRRTSAGEIVQAGLRARDLVRQLLAFSRKQLLEFKPVDLNEVLDRFEKLLQRTIREDVALKIAPAPFLPLVHADVGQLEQVIMNLAVNAQDAMPDGGELTIETVATELDGVYAADRPGVTPGPYVMLSVSDTGTGMDAETRERIFEPFFTTKEKDKGTGLGLATVYGIVKQHGGNIWVYSEPGDGTTFKVYLPVFDGADAPAAEAIVAEQGDLGGDETILLVEDNEQVRDLAHAILERCGYRVVPARNGEEALAALDRRDGRIHLLLSDVVMPGMNGRELFDQISGRCPDIKVLYMSGYTDNVIAHRGVRDEGVDFIQKPFSVKALAAKVREVLENDGR